MGWLEIAALVASIVSVIVGLLAIVLTVIFFRMSSDVQTSTAEAATDIRATVDKLEKLFDVLYSDTFGVMKEIVGDMRKQIWPEALEVDQALADEIDRRTEEKAQALTSDLAVDLKRLVKSQVSTEAKVTNLTEDLQQVLERAIVKSMKIDDEARGEALREQVIDRFHQLGKRGFMAVKADDVVSYLDKKGVSFSAVLRELKRLNREGLISYDDKKGIGPSTRIDIRGLGTS